MHDLVPLNALGTKEAKAETIGAVTLSEVPDLALASLAARRGKEEACAQKLSDLLGAPAPGPDEAALAEPYAAVWMARAQWMVGAPFETHEDIADHLKAEFGALASITEQSDAWVTIDLAGEGTVDLLERLCPAPTRRMPAGAARRTSVHQMGCFLLCGAPGVFYRVLGPRSSASSLWHALKQAALSLS